nr:CaiB/BaiF CoA-transferase family protein [Sphingobium subterraneum]
MQGITVVALEQAVAAPLATSRLADAGARVIKLERPDGDSARHFDAHAKGSSSYFVWLNRNKQSCRVDLRNDEDIELVRAMIAKADVFIQNLAPGATGRLGLGSKALRAAYPRLITCDISGYAANTPFADRKAYDLMIQGESGLASITGTADSGPSRVGVSICDIATGMAAHAQLLEALIARGTTGQGRSIAVSLFDVATEIMNIPYITHRHGNAAPKPSGLLHPLIAPYGVYETRDRPLLIAVQSEQEWIKFCNTVLRRPDMAADARFGSNRLRIENRPAMESEIIYIFQYIPYTEAITRLEEGRIAYAQISQMDDMVSHPALAKMMVAVAGQFVELVAPPSIVDGRRPDPGTVPDLGAHDGMLRREFAHPGPA